MAAGKVEKEGTGKGGHKKLLFCCGFVGVGGRDEILRFFSFLLLKV